MTKNYSNYSLFGNFGNNENSGIGTVSDPLSYVLPGQTMSEGFLHGSVPTFVYGGMHSPNGQAFLSSYCAGEYSKEGTGWDKYCEFSSANRTITWPNTVQNCLSPSCLSQTNLTGGQTAGQILIKNSSNKRFLKAMHNAKKKYEPFDPTVANSPVIYTWVPVDCAGAGNMCGGNNPTGNNSGGIPVYAVDPKTIDNEPLMDKLLRDLSINPELLLNVYNTMKREGTLSQLKGTKIGRLYSTHPYFTSRGGLGV